MVAKCLNSITYFGYNFNNIHFNIRTYNWLFPQPHYLLQSYKHKLKLANNPPTQNHYLNIDLLR